MDGHLPLKTNRHKQHTRSSPASMHHRITILALIVAHLPHLLSFSATPLRAAWHLRALALLQPAPPAHRLSRDGFLQGPNCFTKMSIGGTEKAVASWHLLGGESSKMLGAPWKHVHLLLSLANARSALNSLLGKRTCIVCGNMYFLMFQAQQLSLLF